MIESFSLTSIACHSSEHILTALPCLPIAQVINNSIVQLKSGDNKLFQYRVKKEHGDFLKKHGLAHVILSEAALPVITLTIGYRWNPIRAPHIKFLQGMYEEDPDAFAWCLKREVFLLKFGFSFLHPFVRASVYLCSLLLASSNQWKNYRFTIAIFLAYLFLIWLSHFIANALQRFTAVYILSKVNERTLESLTIDEVKGARRLALALQRLNAWIVQNTEKGVNRTRYDVWEIKTDVLEKKLEALNVDVESLKKSTAEEIKIKGLVILFQKFHLLTPDFMIREAFQKRILSEFKPTFSF